MPRIRESLILRKGTGKADVVREVLPDADLDQRIRDLKAVIPAGTPRPVSGRSPA
jgi:hypothetical protein